MLSSGDNIPHYYIIHSLINFRLSEVQHMLVDLSKKRESKDIYELAIGLAGYLQLNFPYPL